MRIKNIEFHPLSIPYTHTESSSLIDRDGVSDIVVRIVADNGLVGWGESCSGANTQSVLEALRAFRPLLIGRNPWNREALWHDASRKAIWFYRESTFNFAWAGVDMALWDLCGKAAHQPVYNLLGGPRRREVEYFSYLSYGSPEEVIAQCRDGIERGYRVFYIKVGLDINREAELVRLIRECIGPERKLRIDANEAWSVAEAVRNLDLLDRWNIDFAEQPVPSEPVANMVELKRKTRVPLAANEGLWRRVDAWEVIRQRAADILCFSPYWVGSINNFSWLSQAAELEGLTVCKHTHGEFGIAAAACQHVLLTLPSIVVGHQQSAAMMSDDILTAPLPIAAGPMWGLPAGDGLGIEVDEAKLAKYERNFEERGQYLPYSMRKMGEEDPGWPAALGTST